MTSEPFVFISSNKMWMNLINIIPCYFLGGLIRLTSLTSMTILLFYWLTVKSINWLNYYYRLNKNSTCHYLNEIPPHFINEIKTERLCRHRHNSMFPRKLMRFPCKHEQFHPYYSTHLFTGPVNMTWRTKSLSGQMIILTGYWTVTSPYVEPSDACSADLVMPIRSL